MAGGWISGRRREKEDSEDVEKVAAMKLLGKLMPGAERAVGKIAPKVERLALPAARPQLALPASRPQAWDAAAEARARFAGAKTGQPFEAPMMHGSNQPLTMFDDAARGANTNMGGGRYSSSADKAHFLTDDTDAALYYARMATNRGGRTIGSPTINHAQVKMKNPLVLDTGTEMKDWPTWARSARDDGHILDLARQNGHDGVIRRGLVDAWGPAHPSDMAKFRTQQAHWDSFPPEVAEKMWHAGTLQRPIVPGSRSIPSNVAAVFDPSQVKFASEVGFITSTLAGVSKPQQIKSAALDLRKAWNVLRRIKTEGLTGDMADMLARPLDSTASTLHGSFFKHPDVMRAGIKSRMPSQKIQDMLKGLVAPPAIPVLPPPPAAPIQGMLDLFKQGQAHPALPALRAAKEHSDAGDYSMKHKLIRQNMRRHADDWSIDSDDGKGIVGVTHIPTGFRLHMPKGIVDPDVLRYHNPRNRNR